jgi:dihydrofolate reductase
MRRIIGAAFQSLDGVVQAPGAPEEDRSGGFELGGWLAGYFDEEAGKQIDRLFGGSFDLLLGRRTYDIFAAYWPFAKGENAAMGAMFTKAGKYVLTRGQQPLPWENSHRLESIEALTQLKQGDGPDLVIQGSSTLYPQLLKAGLLDRLTLMTFPLVLGKGKRLFGEETPPGAMRMTEHQVSAAGNFFATYEPAGAVRPGSFASEEPSEAELERREKIEEGAW